MTRARFLSTLAAATAGLLAGGKVRAAQASPAESRIADIIRAYDAQGYHRTATKGDNDSAVWLAKQAEAAGGRFGIEQFPLARVDVSAAFVECNGTKADGLPLFDGTFTTPQGIDGVLGAAGSRAPIVVTTMDAAGVQSEGRSLAALRREPGTQAIIAITKGAHPGLSPANAVDFRAPYGVPVLQVGSEHEPWLLEAIAEGRRARLVAAAVRTNAKGVNVSVRVEGERDDLTPVMVITPRSGWWQCAGERGGGLACWLEAIRATSATPAPRAVWFYASSGHELGHLGLEAFLHRQPEWIKRAMWIHLGANIGVAGGAMRLQASDDEMAGRAVAALNSAGAALDRQVPRGTVPAGEARNIHVGGGRYISLLGTSPYFHSQADRFPKSVDVPAVARYARAVSDIIAALRT